MYNGAATRNGCIYLKSKDSLWGIVKFVPYFGKSFTYVEILPKGKAVKGSNIVRIERENIDFVRVYPDDKNDMSRYVDYYYLGHKKEKDAGQTHYKFIPFGD